MSREIKSRRNKEQMTGRADNFKVLGASLPVLLGI